MKFVLFALWSLTYLHTTIKTSRIMKEIWKVETRCFARELDGSENQIGTSTDELFFSSKKKAERQVEEDIKSWVSIDYELEEEGLFPHYYARLKSKWLIRLITMKRISID